MNIRLTIIIILAICAAVLATPESAYANPGDLYFSDGGNNVNVFTPDGTQSPSPFATVDPSAIETSLGVGPSLLGLAFDSAGNLYLADAPVDESGSPVDGGGRIVKIDTNRIQSDFASGLNYPVGLAFDSAGNLFVATHTADGTLNSQGTILKFTSGGAQSTFATGLIAPRGIAFDSAGNLYVSDSGDDTNGLGTLFKFTHDGMTRTTLATGLNRPRGVAFDSAGNLYLVERNISDILKFSPSEQESIFASGIVGTIIGIALDAASNVFVAHSGNDDVLKFTPDGIESVFAPVPGPDIIWLAFEPNTTIGTNEMVNLGAVGSANTNIALTFPNILSGGTTMAAPIDPSSAGYTLPGSSLGFDITTTAAYPTPVPTPPGIVIAFRVAPPLDVSQLTVFHNESGTLVNVTCPIPNPGPTPDLTTNTIYASVTSLSPFVVAKVPFAAHVQQPINADGTSVFSVRRGVVPVKFTLTQDGTATCTLPTATIAVTRTSGGTTGAIDESIYGGSADTGSNFRISSCQYLYNLSSSALGVGTYRADIKINGIVVGSGTFQLK